MSRRALTTIVTRQQVLLERLKTQVSRDFTRVLPEVEAAIRDVLYGLRVDAISDLSQAKLRGLLADLQAEQEKLITSAQEALLGDLEDLAKYQAPAEARTLRAAVRSGQLDMGITPTAGQDAYAYALKRPLSASGTLLEPFIETWGAKQVQGVEQAVQRAWAEGRTIPQLVTEIRGTRRGGFKDGLIGASRRQAEAIARTSVQHVAQAARQATWEDNSDLVEAIIWVATLDSRTTQQCRSLDGREFPLDSGPRPPIHVNCRSTTRPKLPKALDFLDEGATRSSEQGYVDANQTYYGWLKQQPAEFQDTALGPDRGALFRNGGLSSEEFSRLNLDRNFEPLTLEEMAAREPQAFEQAGLDKYLPPDN